MGISLQAVIDYYRAIPTEYSSFIIPALVVMGVLICVYIYDRRKKPPKEKG